LASQGFANLHFAALGFENPGFPSSPSCRFLTPLLAEEFLQHANAFIHMLFQQQEWR
jgi:hypothetical protein